MTSDGWPVRARPTRPHRHAAKYLWVDDDEHLWRCDYRGCTWSRPYEPWEECVTYGLLHEGHAGPLVRTIAPATADLVCPTCGALACEFRPQLRVVV